MSMVVVSSLITNLRRSLAELEGALESMGELVSPAPVTGTTDELVVSELVQVLERAYESSSPEHRHPSHEARRRQQAREVLDWWRKREVAIREEGRIAGLRAALYVLEDSDPSPELGAAELVAVLARHRDELHQARKDVADLRKSAGELAELRKTARFMELLRPDQAASVREVVSAMAELASMDLEAARAQAARERDELLGYLKLISRSCGIELPDRERCARAICEAVEALREANSDGRDYVQSLERTRSDLESRLAVAEAGRLSSSVGKRDQLALAFADEVKRRKQGGQDLRLPGAWDERGREEYALLADVAIRICGSWLGEACAALAPLAAVADAYDRDELEAPRPSAADRDREHDVELVVVEREGREIIRLGYFVEARRVLRLLREGLPSEPAEPQAEGARGEPGIGERVFWIGAGRLVRVRSHWHHCVSSETNQPVRGFNCDEQVSFMMSDEGRTWSRLPPELADGEICYIRDTRQVVGNDVLFWRPGGQGYTCDLREAGIYTTEGARMATSRPTDVLVPCRLAWEASQRVVHVDALEAAAAEVKKRGGRP